MGAAVAHDLSPELVLVCPELRAQALELLPAIDPDALFEVAPRPKPALALVPPAPAPAPRPRVLAVAAYAAEALVMGMLRGAALIAVIASAAFLLAR
jgi:hypothetical protein